MKVFLSPNPNPPHNLIVFFPAYNDPSRPPNLSDDDFLQYVIGRNRETGKLPANAPVYIVEHDAIVADHVCSGDCEFFDAWEWDGRGAVVNMPKARMMLMDRIRRSRDAELAKLDVPYMRALEAGDATEQQRIAREKQLLRDIPQTFGLGGYATPEALKAAWPDGLDVL